LRCENFFKGGYKAGDLEVQRNIIMPDEHIIMGQAV